MRTINILRHFRRWLIEKYLPAYVCEVNKEDIIAQQQIIVQQQQKIKEQGAYIFGLERAIKSIRKININISKEE